MSTRVTTLEKELLVGCDRACCSKLGEEKLENMVTVAMDGVTYLREIGEHDFLRAYSLNLRRAELDSCALASA